jgi:signal transduction histidine kinase
VITNEAHNLPPDQKALILRQTSEIAKNIDHYLSRARTFGTEKVLGSRSSIKTVTDDLVYAMQRIYQGRDLRFDLSSLHSCWFKGEAQDLEEMMGNLIDNACKWAKSSVRVTCGTTAGRLEVIVEDDGPGIPEAEYENVMRRGQKLDEAIPGHGQGLGIVKDIAALYNGALEFGRSELGGLKAKLVLPAATTANGPP